MGIARAKGVGISSWKLRRMINLVKGMNTEDAEKTLRHFTSPVAKILLRTIHAAAANTQNNEAQSSSYDFKITQITADNGTKARRYRAKARGRPGSFNRPTSHITVKVEAQ